MMSQKDDYIIEKLHQVFRDGYRPARGDQSYKERLKIGVPAAGMVNCLGHTFNLRNQQFDDYDIQPYAYTAGHNNAQPYFADFMREPYQFASAAQDMLNFIKATGLKVAECAPEAVIDDFASWKIALYFCRDDFHYLLEDAPQKWSGKAGKLSTVEHLRGLKPPLKYTCAADPKPQVYNLYGTYKITNPHADVHNPYVQDRTR